MAKVGFVVLTDGEYEWAYSHFGIQYANRMRTACRKARTYFTNRGFRKSSIENRLREVCLEILADFVEKGDPRLQTAGNSPQTREGYHDYSQDKKQPTLTEEDIRREMEYQDDPHVPSHKASLFRY